jgi:LPS-assembly protein
VTLRRGDTTLTADEVVYDRTNGVAEARGNVVLTDPQGTVAGTFARLDLEDESGWVDRADADFQASQYLLKAGRLEKKGGPCYSVANGVFTTCRCGGLEKPSWSIASRQTDVELEGAGVARGVTFRVKDVPVLYVPYLIFPANTERQSGLLIPRIGFSNRRGFQYEQPFYWAINKSTDATVALDVETEARIGVTGEFRYERSRQTRGGFVGAYFTEAIRGRTRGTLGPNGQPADIPEHRWVIAGHHVQPFWGKSKFYLDTLAVSDDLFLREINTFAFTGRNELALRSTRLTTTRAGVYRGWAHGLARIEADYYQDLIDPQELALQRLPRMEAEHAVPLLGDRVVGRLAAEAVDFQRREGFDGLRGDLAPELMLPFHLGRALFGSVTGRVRETAYYLTDREQVARVVPDPGVAVEPGFRGFRVAPELPDLDRTRTREVAEVNARLGTEIARVFDFPHLGLAKLRHTIEPEARYLFVPQVGRPVDQLALPPCPTPLGASDRPGVTCSATLFSEGYLFDERDAIDRRNFISYGLTTRLLGRPAEAADTAEAAEAPPPTGEGTAPEEAPAGAVDADVLAQGLSADAVPDLIGPPGPRAARAARTAPARELLRASVLHGYDVSRRLVGTSHFSDIDLGLRVAPTGWLGAATNMTVSAEESALRGLSTGVFVREPWWKPAAPRGRSFQTPTTVGSSYRFVEKSVNETPGPPTAESLLLRSNGLNEVDGSLYLRLGDYLGFAFLARYDLSTTTLAGGERLGPHFLERDYLVRLISRCNCWALEAGVADKTNPDRAALPHPVHAGGARLVREWAGDAGLRGLRAALPARSRNRAGAAGTY